MSGYCSVACQVCESKCQSKGQSNYGCCESPNGQGCSGCMDICMDCQTACQWSSQGCQTSCEKSCQTSCERGCQSRCEKGCQDSCERSCQSGAQKNSAPSSPGGVNLPNPIRSEKSFSISWGYASDSDGNLSGYTLERSLDNGSYSSVYNGSSTSYTDTVPKGTKSVRYRVKAYDSYNSTSGYTYSQIVTVVNNSAPIISGSNYDYGAVTENFSINYIVTDSDDGDRVEVKITVDNQIIQDFTETSLGIRKTIDVDLAKYNLGKHKIEIIAKDKEGTTYTRTYTFEKINTAPIISGQDTDLGNKNSAFTIVYTVKDPNNDKVNVVEKLNGKILKNITNIGTGEQSITVTAEMLSEFAINTSNVIEIEARDANNAVSYRRFTFVRSNFAPIISGTDTDLGEKDKEFTYTYSVTDEEKDKIKIKVFLDNRLVVPEFDGVDNKKYKYELKGFDFLKLTLGKHTLKIVATDSNGLVSTRLVSFTRTATRLIMQLKDPRDTDVMAKKVLVIPGWFVAPGATGKVEVCNNAYDSNPTWEDATVVTNEGRAFNFLNSSKTATKWGVNIRLTIEKGKSTVTSYITSIGGSVE